MLRRYVVTDEYLFLQLECFAILLPQNFAVLQKRHLQTGRLVYQRMLVYDAIRAEQWRAVEQLMTSIIVIYCAKLIIQYSEIFHSGVPGVPSGGPARDVVRRVRRRDVHVLQAEKAVSDSIHEKVRRKILRI